MLIIMIALIWILLSYEYGIQGLSVLIIVLPVIYGLYRVLKADTLKGFHKSAIWFFILSVFRSIRVSFLLIYWMLKGKIYEGIYESELGRTPSYSLLFVSCGITIVPDTLFLGKRKGWIYIHKIAPIQKDAFQADVFPSISVGKNGIIDPAEPPLH